MSNKNPHPEQDPAEGSRRVIEKELERQEAKEKKPSKQPDITPQDGVPSEAG
jgi:hypothetical protein